MKSKSIILLIFITLFLSGCGNQFTCGYDPEKFKYTDAFSVDSTDYLNSSLEEFIDDFEEFGVENKFCIANKSKFEKVFNRYSANIQIVSKEISLHIFGTHGFTLHFKQKETNFNKDSEIKKFCNFISQRVDVNNITYYEDKGKLCSY